MWHAILDLVVLFVLLAPVLWFLEMAAGCRRKLLRPGFFTDLFYWFFTPMVTHWITRNGIYVSGLLLALALGWAPKGIPRDGFGPVSHQPKILQAIEIIIMADLIGYWTHRLFHNRPLWGFHAIHHSAHDVDWMTTQRIHPINDLGTRLAQAIPLFAMGYTPTVLAIFPLLDSLYAQIVHAELNWTFGPLRYVLVSPVFHRWHHSRQSEAVDKNFATLFPVWDLLFGTLYLPAGRVPGDFGVSEAVPENLLGQLAYPFIGNRSKAGAADAQIHLADAMIGQSSGG